MSDAADKVADQLAILVARIKERMIEGGVVRSDETYIRYLDRIIPGGSARGYFWVYRGLDGDVIFDWQTSREHHHLADWLGADFEGILQSDGYEAYERYCELQRRRGKDVRRAACLAHIRRKFEKALKERPALVRWILKIIGRLYRTEAMLREHRAPPEVRARVRQNLSRPLIRLLGKAFRHLRATAILPKSTLGQALNYALGQWSAMETYLEDGRIEIDNNDTENDIRPSAVSKKNWLFIGHPEAGRRSAILYTLLISARNHGIDPQAYLKDVIERLPSMRPADLDALLPSAWAAAHRAKHPLAKPDRTATAA
ncbi:IS66 family transposase ISVsp3 [Haloferula sargassicola]|uniref:IS66 family transposase ISVsp3 n=2 Tax=Haloferula sargassicola TaxID=490096 RepID=A0ABP9USI2_9BACT